MVGTRVLKDFADRHADVRPQIEAWFWEAEEANWRVPQDIKARYSSASFFSDNRVVFNLKGRKYRLLAKINYEQQIVLVVNVGTHTEYSTWDL